LPVAVVLWDAAPRLVYANAAAETLLGAPLAQLHGRGLSDVLQAVSDDGTPIAASSPQPAPDPLNGQKFLVRPDGAQRWVLVRSVPALGPAGDASWSVSTFVDQTVARQAEEALKVERGLLQTLMDSVPDHIYFKDRASRITRANKAQAAYFNVSDPAEEIGKSDFDFYAHDLAAALFAEEQAIMSTKQPLIGSVEDHSARAGRPYWIQSTKVPIVQHGEVIGLVGISRDVTELKLVQERLAHQALHDYLTGLPNRVLLLDRLDQVLRTAQREHTSFALCLLDLDHFKEVNDTLGHERGDRVLQEVATRIYGVLRDSDTVARLGGDEFAILLPGVNADGAIATATRVKLALQTPLDLDGFHPDMAGSIGITLFPLHASDVATLLIRADIAMYAAKQAGGGYAIYDAQLDERNPDYLTLPQEFYRALTSNELFLHYQPLVDLAAGNVTTVEALLRWKHPQHGSIAPDRILPLAERIGVLDSLTKWVLNTALEQCRVWHDAGFAFRVAVNIAPRTLRDPNLPEMVAQALRQHGVDAASLALEITEEGLSAAPQQTMEVLAELDAIGVHIAIDDFGTGFSSMAHLRQLPVHEIKIDRSFVGQMKPGLMDEAIVRSVIDLGHNLGMAVVAEGIEDQATLSKLTELSCDSGQGFFVSRPVSAIDLERWMHSSIWGRPGDPHAAPESPA